MGDNGKVEEKTEEQLASERLARYQADPHSFIELNEVVTCVIRNPVSQLGISIFIGNCKRSELDLAEIELSHRTTKRRMQWDIEIEMKAEAAKKLITPGKHSIMDFARRKR